MPLLREGQPGTLNKPNCYPCYKKYRNDFEFAPLVVKNISFFVLEKDTRVRFRLVSDDGSALFIDEQLVIDNWGAHAIKSVANSLHLRAGNHKIRLFYFNLGGGAIAKLYWRLGNGPEEIIPAKYLQPEGNND